MDDGAALILTVANYYNPGGKSILEEGITPTEIVRAVPEDSDSGDDDAAPAPEPQKEPGLARGRYRRRIRSSAGRWTS